MNNAQEEIYYTVRIRNRFSQMGKTDREYKTFNGAMRRIHQIDCNPEFNEEPGWFAQIWMTRILYDRQPNQPPFVTDKVWSMPIS